METANFVFSVLAAALGLIAFFVAARTWSEGGRGRAVGWLVLALAALVQMVNLSLGYSWVLSVATTAGILLGLWMLLRANRRPG